MPTAFALDLTGRATHIVRKVLGAMVVTLEEPQGVRKDITGDETQAR